MRSKPGQLGLSTRELPGPRELARSSEEVLGGREGQQSLPSVIMYYRTLIRGLGAPPDSAGI